MGILIRIVKYLSLESEPCRHGGAVQLSDVTFKGWCG